MESSNKNVISNKFSIRESLSLLNEIGVKNNVLFIVDEANKMIATITDGDIRRGLLNNLEMESLAIKTANFDFSFIYANVKNSYSESVDDFRKKGIKYIPLLDKRKKILKIIDSENYRGYLPVDVFILAGGKGSRLMPLTENCPKPMLKIGEKPIIEHNIDRLISFGVNRFTISINYLGNVLESYFNSGSSKGVEINYVEENEPLGTLGSISLASEFKRDYILVMNSDLLTDIDFIDFFETFLKSDALLSVANTPYSVDVPYAILDMDENNNVKALREKPKFTYHSNAGIYIIKKEVLSKIPYNQYYNATDLIEDIIKRNGKVSTYTILGYWLDIGKMPDYLKAQEDINHLKL